MQISEAEEAKYIFFHIEPYILIKWITDEENVEWGLGFVHRLLNEWRQI